MFRSVLFLSDDPARVDQKAAPTCFRDLNLDQVVDAITHGRDEYELKPFFYSPLQDVDAVIYRQEVFRDLEPRAVRDALRAFAERMRSMRGLLAQKLYYHYQRRSWSFDAAEAYAAGVARLLDDLNATDLRSRGMVGLRDYLATYVSSTAFSSLRTEAVRVKEALGRVRYHLLIQGDRVTVSRDDSETDYTVEIEDTFERFKRGEPKDYLIKLPPDPDLNYLGILDRIALLHPDAFGALDTFCERHAAFVDPTIARFDREIQYYLAYLERVDALRSAGLAFSYPRVSDRSKEVCARDTFDIALAGRLIAQHAEVVTNDFHLSGRDRVIVVTGPNQGGKTTFARTFAQLHYLASLGCPVPGSEAQLCLCDGIFTHFEREEQLADLRGKLQDDLLRVRDILERATPQTIVVLNEVFTSTTLEDALFLSTEVMQRVIERDFLCVWVTFVDELAAVGERVVSMVSNVRPEDPTVRTFKITRRPADGHAYAAAIAAKYGVSYARLKERLPSESVPAA